MKRTLLNLSLIYTLLTVLTSCGTLKSYNFKTSGIAGADSSYLVTTSGKRIDATDIDVKPGKLTVDGKPYPLDDISSIRSKRMYFGVSNGKMYLGEVYGKINILYELIYVPTYTSMPGSGYGSGQSMVTGGTTQRKYYLQKQGSTEIVKMSMGAVLDYVSDNEEAMAVATNARKWKTGYLLSWVAMSGSVVYAFSNVFSSGGTDANGHLKGSNMTGPMIAVTGSLAGMWVTYDTYHVRMFKAIEVYNR